MRVTLRLILALTVGIALVAFLFAFLQVREDMNTVRQQTEDRIATLAGSLKEQVEPDLRSYSRRDLADIVDRFQSWEKLTGVAIYDAGGGVVVRTSGADVSLAREALSAPQGSRQDFRGGYFFYSSESDVLVYVLPVVQDKRLLGTLLFFNETTSFLKQRSHLWQSAFLRALAEVGLIALITVLIIRWSIFGPLDRTLKWLGEVRKGNLFRRRLPQAGVLLPLEQEVSQLVRSLETARAAAKQEARLRQAGESIWTAERLRIHIRSKIQQNPMFVISNREPFMHVRKGNSIEVSVPASGLVTALEPVLCASNGTWIAHGSGDADRETVDSHDRLRVPPEQPEYTLRRVWLTKEEEEGYYFGFANEGLWPLCHIAHARPIFRASDWEYYQAVNQKFARAALQEMKDVEEPIVLVQDYHFAVLPRLIKDERPDARVAIFWHIPWPNPEAVRICPWQRELLDGLLGADLIGFHIQAHCNNFLDTVERAIEARVEWERFAVRRGGHITQVRPLPISVDFSESPHPTQTKSPYVLRANLFKNLGINARFLGVGVDRVDYTKGILERFRGIERFFEKYPNYREKFTFVQIGAPSRTHIKRYHDLLNEVEEEAERINWRFQAGSWKPIILLTKHHSHREIEPYYQAADLCLVSSLHDGMNLVAKEFVASRYDEEGALILSQFTGAARELPDALLVNPYDSDQIADAIFSALEMEPEERQRRMRHMRLTIRESNVYRWAGDLISALCEIRVERTGAPADESV